MKAFPLRSVGNGEHISCNVLSLQSACLILISPFTLTVHFQDSLFMKETLYPEYEYLTTTCCLRHFLLYLRSRFWRWLFPVSPPSIHRSQSKITHYFFFSSVKGVHCVERRVQTAFPVILCISVFLRGTEQSNSSTLTAIWYTALLHKHIFKTPSH